eukprot:1754759-Rhodomonas_salina.1
MSVLRHPARFQRGRHRALGRRSSEHRSVRRFDVSPALAPSCPHLRNHHFASSALITFAMTNTPLQSPGPVRQFQRSVLARACPFSLH